MHAFKTFKKVLVCGWTGHGNLGDEAFKTAFHELWPGTQFTFTDIVPRNINDYDALIFGGGSLFDRPLPGLEKCHPEIPIAFIGVGLHGTVHPSVAPWLRIAQVVVVRDKRSWDLARRLVSSKVFPYLTADLLYARRWPAPRIKNHSKRLLILVNAFMAPSRQSARWQVAAWDRFEMELATALDETYADWTIEFFPMLLAKNGPSDDYAAARIVSQMSNRWRVRDNIWRPTESKLIESIQRADLVITQRFHGAVLASILSTPFIGISAHDKMRSFFTDSALNNYCDYYSFTRESLAQATDAIPALYRFARLREESHARWHMLAQEIEDRLSTSEVIPLMQMTNPERL